MTKKIKRTIVWIVFNGFIAWSAWQGVFNHVEWTQNLFKFLVWLNFVMTILLFIGYSASVEIKEKVHETGMSVPTSVSMVYDLLLAGSLAAAGWFCYSALIVIQGFMQVGIYSQNEKKL